MPSIVSENLTDTQRHRLKLTTGHSQHAPDRRRHEQHPRRHRPGGYDILGLQLRDDAGPDLRHHVPGALEACCDRRSREYQRHVQQARH